jgi:serine/threonine protein kinase
MVDRILRCEYTRMRFGVWDNISPEAIQFVKSLLQCDPAARPSAPEALQSPWMLKHFASEEVTAGVTPSPSSGTVDRSEYDPQEANEGDEEQELADETNTSIPGGRTDPSHTPTKYRYDTHTKSIRSCC